MKVFKIESQDYQFDEDVSMVIVAASAKRALVMAIEKWQFRDEPKNVNLKVNEINICKEQIVDMSHYGD